MYRDISRGESFKRTLFSLNLTPQAKKEKSIERVFDRLGLEDETRQTVMDEFFTSPPTKLSDIGYWRGRFYLKNITMQEFLAAQIGNRVKLDFREEEKLEGLFKYNNVESKYVTDETAEYFQVKFKIADQATSTDKDNLRVKKIGELIKIANKVVYGYKFTDFDFLILEDQLENARLSVRAQDVYDFAKKKLVVEEIAQAPAGYFSVKSGQ